jgi:hypothetical protein
MQSAVTFVIEFCDTGGRIRSDDVNPRASTRVSESGGAERRGRGRHRHRRCRAAPHRAARRSNGEVTYVNARSGVRVARCAEWGEE